jgi:heme-degrading monooxygenase HmoA
MIRVLYSYQVKAGKEKEFIESWTRVTRFMRTTQTGSKGAMLTQDLADKQQFIVVARWESYDRFKAYHNLGSTGSSVEKAMQATLAGPVAIQIVDEVADLTMEDDKKG